MLRIAVTGVAGASGQSVIKAAKLMRDPVEIIPVDVTLYSAGLFLGDHPGVVLPKPEQNIEAWIKFVHDYRIDAIIPGADRDLIPLSKYAEETKTIVSRPEVIDIADDKFKTAEYLSSIGVPIPKYALPEEADNWQLFPCVVKPRSDAASRGFNICQDREELNFFLKRTRNPLIQEYIDGDEYTCNVFCNSEGVPVAQMIMLRKERGGIAIQAQPVRDEAIAEMLVTVGAALKPKGTISIQLRKVLDKPLSFEINARCSGSTIVRALAGYNDVEMLIDQYVRGKEVQQPEINYNVFAFRYYSEVVVETDKLRSGKIAEDLR